MGEFTTAFTKTFFVQNTWARSGTLTRVFAEMAEEAYEAYQVEKTNRVREPPEDGYSEKRVEQDDLMTKLGIKSIVFTAMALEAGVFELAAINLGDATTTDYLEKLDINAKWFVVPRLICGHSLAEKGPALNNLSTLIKARNQLVHCKSKPFPGYQPDPESPTGWTEQSMKEVEERASEIAADSRKFASYVQASFPTLVLISLELEALIGNSGPLPGFSKGAKHTRAKRSSLLSNLIGEWRKSHSKYHEKA
ncbi:hypothetical protein FQ186_03715 [Pseudomonas sp. ANT_H14]|uniref:hypothetical protein n=1 Tax=unclassified Pseudomonas TaxID=196821 RepID=UPI0011EC24C7|nr:MULTISPECIES: hypothetical protein [unclassified Pseudomonas]KAA0948940.1 hypothetical protein FQ182_04580 [Pseudomonas sp. ANT_H4]KAA0954282.1 hypothetical protein FQ186_03715 [Pseudomonas sp. ANT_H14]